MRDVTLDIYDINTDVYCNGQKIEPIKPGDMPGSRMEGEAVPNVFEIDEGEVWGFPDGKFIQIPHYVKVHNEKNNNYREITKRYNIYQVGVGDKISLKPRIENIAQKREIVAQTVKPVNEGYIVGNLGPNKEMDFVVANDGLPFNKKAGYCFGTDKFMLRQVKFLDTTDYSQLHYNMSYYPEDLKTNEGRNILMKAQCRIPHRSSVISYGAHTYRGQNPSPMSQRYKTVGMQLIFTKAVDMSTVEHSFKGWDKRLYDIRNDVPLAGMKRNDGEDPQRYRMTPDITVFPDSEHNTLEVEFWSEDWIETCQMSEVAFRIDRGLLSTSGDPLESIDNGDDVIHTINFQTNYPALVIKAEQFQINHDTGGDDDYLIMFNAAAGRAPTEAEGEYVILSSHGGYEHTAEICEDCKDKWYSLHSQQLLFVEEIQPDEIIEIGGEVVEQHSGEAARFAKTIIDAVDAGIQKSPAPIKWKIASKLVGETGKYLLDTGTFSWLTEDDNSYKSISCIGDDSWYEFKSDKKKVKGAGLWGADLLYYPKEVIVDNGLYKIKFSIYLEYPTRY